MKSFGRFLHRIWKSEAFSPTAFIVRALVIAVFFCISELLGLREYTSFLSGTSANLTVSWQTSATLGLIHLLLYVAFVLLTPIFLITAALLAAWEKARGQRCAERTPSEPALHERTHS